MSRKKASTDRHVRLDTKMTWVPTKVPECLSLARRLLLVGQVAEFSELVTDNTLRHVVRTHFSLVSASLLDSVRPDTVVSPLIQHGWDCVDLANKLHEGGFIGTLVIDAVPIPSLEMVRREILGLCPGLSVAMLIRN